MMHSHSTSDCTLTVNQIPSHDHAMAMGTNTSSASPWDKVSFNWEERPYAWLDTAPCIPEGGNQPHNHGDTSLVANISPSFAINLWIRIK